jgi:hypothetical protein
MVAIPDGDWDVHRQPFRQFCKASLAGISGLSG